MRSADRRNQSEARRLDIGALIIGIGLGGILCYIVVGLRISYYRGLLPSCKRRLVRKGYLPHFRGYWEPSHYSLVAEVLVTVSGARLTIFTLFPVVSILITKNRDFGMWALSPKPRYSYALLCRLLGV